MLLRVIGCHLFYPYTHDEPVINIHDKEIKFIKITTGVASTIAFLSRYSWGVLVAGAVTHWGLAAACKIIDYNRKLNKFRELVKNYSADRDEDNRNLLSLLNAHYTADTPLKNGKTALHYAAKSGNESLIKILLSYEANVNCEDRKGRTPLSRAAEKGHIPIFKIIKEKGAKVEGIWQKIAVSGMPKKVFYKELEKEGLPPLNPSETDPWGRDLATIAMENNNADMLFYLHKQKIRTVTFIEALNANNGELALKLLDSGEAPDWPQKEFSALHTAISIGYQPLIEKLANHAKVNINENCRGCTPLDFAIYCGNQEAREFLEKKGAVKTLTSFEETLQDISHWLGKNWKRPIKNIGGWL